MAMPHRTEPADDIEELICVLARSVVNDLVTAGASVVPIGKAADGTSLAGVDGLVLLGGGDVGPALFMEASSAAAAVGAEAVGHVDSGRDQAEIDMIRQAVQYGLPTLAICRGMQILNVALGGTLLLDLPATDTIHHGRGTAHELMVEHDVWANPDTRLARVLGRAPVSVWSGHHQGIDRLADNLVPSAHAADGLIEAVEHLTAPILGIQWHPEYNTRSNNADSPDANVAAEPPKVFIDLVTTALANARSHRETAETGTPPIPEEPDTTT